MKTNSPAERDGHGVEIPYTNLGKWKRDELEGKSVEYHLGESQEGIGTFRVSGPTDKGLHFVQIAADKGATGDQLRVTHHYIPQAAVDRICRHPNQSVAEFLLP